MEIRKNILLADFSNYRVGGSADYFAQVRSVGDIKAALGWAAQRQLGFFILGGGTNVLFTDSGFRGLVVKINNGGYRFDGVKLRAGAGATVPALVAACTDQELTGLEWAGGLPGTLGGAIRGNAGCFGGEIKDVVESVSALTPQGELLSFSNRECGFSYRHSRFKEEKLIVAEAVLNLKKDLSKEELAGIVQGHIDYRLERQPLDWPNCGSVFKNVPLAKAPRTLADRFKDVIKIDPFPLIPTAALIHEAGLKGYAIGGAQVSPKHPNFIINVGRATGADILGLLNFVKAKIKDEFGVGLEVEIDLVGFDKSKIGQC